jgi:hypothetical protein
MADISGFPYFEVQFTKQGEVFEPAERRAVMDAVGELDELFVVAHGWNNDMAEARALYRALFANVRQALDRGRAPSLAGRRIGVPRRGKRRAGEREESREGEGRG